MKDKLKQSVIFVILAIISLEAFAYEWQPASSGRDEVLYRVKDFPDLIGILKLKNEKENIIWKKSDLRLFSQKLQSTKKQALSLIGIKNWTVVDSKWTKLEAHFELVLKGSYVNLQNQKIHFLELHYYFKNKNWQAILTDTDPLVVDKITNSFKSQIEANFD